MTPKAKVTKAKIAKLDFTKIKNVTKKKSRAETGLAQ